MRSAVWRCGLTVAPILGMKLSLAFDVQVKMDLEYKIFGYGF